MRLFLYEFVSGGGWWHVDPSTAPQGSLLAEGSAMRNALAADFHAFCEVVTTADTRCPTRSPEGTVRSIRSAAEDRDVFRREVEKADWTVVIAPEFDQHLLERCRCVEALGRKLLGPSSAFVEVASDKERTALRLAEYGVPVPAGRVWSGPFSSIRAVDLRGVDFPCVVKPRDGAGSDRVQRVADLESLVGIEMGTGHFRIERFCPGMAASISVLAGPGGVEFLPAGKQRLSDDGRFQYRGGEWPLPSGWAGRARDLAAQVVRAMPDVCGYFGIDLVLGDDPEGADDVVIEVNPRLTTSYLGLRRLSRKNLAAAMWDLACGRPADLSFRAEPLQFAPWNGGDSGGE